MLALLAWFFTAPSAWSFPENVRHGYVNCTSCHVSPSGGGVITAYGRELSKELMSTWSREGEQGWAYGVVTPPEWLTLGGDYRSVYVYRDTPGFRDGRYIFMQGDLEAAATANKFTAVATLGYQSKSNPPAGKIFDDHLLSRRHYLLYHATDEISVRAGRFLPMVGINIPEHITFIKENLGWDEGAETYNLEAAYQGDAYSLFATAITGRPDQPSQARETGLALNGGYAFGERYKAGATFYHLQSDVVTRNVSGAWGILGFTPEFFLLGELDFEYQNSRTVVANTWGVFDYLRLDYEWLKGFHTYVTQEYSKEDFHVSGARQTRYGLGIQWLPRPHFDLNLSWMKWQASASADTVDYAYLMFHYYL